MATWKPIETPADFVAAIKIGKTQEGLHLDFKVDLNRKGADAQKEFARDVCQFANVEGGTLLLGVEEERQGDAKVAMALRRIDDFDGRREWMEQAIKNYLVPSTTTVRIARLDVPDGPIIAVNVHPSERTVSVWDDQNGAVQYVRRTNHGKAYMNPDEAVAHMMNTGRAAKLALQRVFDGLNGRPSAQEVFLASGIWARYELPVLERQPARVQITKESIQEYHLALYLELAGSRPVLMLPYGFIREVWPTADRKLGLMLNVRVVVEPGDELTLEPF